MPAPAAERLGPAIERMKMSRADRVLKRTLDACGAFVLLVILSPIILIASLLVKAQDGGPVFHRRRVVGPKGEFDAFKLRTMRVDADQILARDPELRREFEVNFKLKKDPRITPIGNFLRKSSLDELPQFWNVLKGEMSLVGPRMITPAELQKFGEAGWIYSCMRPGVTGYWQVQGRQNVSYDERVQMEEFYVRNWSLVLDLKILIKTPLRVLRGAGAY
ncbi:MAG TPA: sugar transferase [Candidatus Angelobacter sp.]|nr:sugar transferase [Candidatus Angelobacter sp.]